MKDCGVHGLGSSVRIRRSKLVDRDRRQVFHVVSRVVDRRKIFGTEERRFFLATLRRLEAFCGIQVLTYSLMGNHFHLLLLVPSQSALDRQQLFSRAKQFYSGNPGRLRLLERMFHEAKDTQALSELCERIRARMGDISVFVKELKESFSRWYNKREGRVGTLWEGRFRSVLVEIGMSALTAVARYIEMNSVRAGLVDEPDQFAFCGYGESRRGGKAAIDGLFRLHQLVGNAGESEPASVLKTHARRFLNADGNSVHSRCGTNGRVRAMSEGIMLGRLSWTLATMRLRGIGRISAWREVESSRGLRSSEPLVSAMDCRREIVA